MEVNYILRYGEQVVRKHIPSLPPRAKDLIKNAIEERLAVDPVRFGKPLQYSLKGHRRLRVSDCRIVYRIDGASHTVIIVAIKHRKDIYENV